jgi:hypothetical protein
VFRVVANDGLWDMFLGCFFIMFSVAPLLSTRLGDFWASAIFLPVWGALYLAIRLVRNNVILPRVGQVRFGEARRTALGKISRLMLVVNILALVLGIIATIYHRSIPGQMISIAFGLMLLIGFSLAAYVLNLSRLNLYGLLAGISPPIGEWLFSRGLTTHHGFPVTFGIVAGVMILIGLGLFVQLLRRYPAPGNGLPGMGD